MSAGSSFSFILDVLDRYTNRCLQLSVKAFLKIPFMSLTSRAGKSRGRVIRERWHEETTSRRGLNGRIIVAMGHGRTSQ